MDRINLTEDETLLVQIFLSILLVIALTLNIAYLFSIKSFNDRVNATEALQYTKTTIIILALILHLPLEIITTSVKGWNFRNICLLKDFLEKLLMEMYPLTVLVIAITRLRVCVCLGNASILVTKTSAFVTLAFSIIFPLGFALGSFVLKMRMEFAENHNLFIYDLITLMLVSIITIFVSCVIYAFIYFRVKANANPMCNLQPRNSRNFQQRRYRTMSVVRQKQDANVQLSIVVLMTVFISSWSMYATLKVINGIFDFKVAKITLSFSKGVVYLLHPIAEGMFTEQKRNNMEYCIRRICHRTKFNRRTAPDLSSFAESAVVRNVSRCHKLSSVQEFPLSLETRESTSTGKEASNDSLHTKRTGRIIPPFQIPLNDEEKVQKHICCEYCQESLDLGKTYCNCPAELSTYDVKQSNKNIGLSNKYLGHTVEPAPIPELFLTPHSPSHNQTVSYITPRNKWQSFRTSRPIQSHGSKFRFRSFSNDWKAKDYQNRFGLATCQSCLGTKVSLPRRSRTSSCISFDRSSKSCKHTIEMCPNGEFQNVSPVGRNQRSMSSLKSCLKSKRRDSKSSYDSSSSVFIRSPSFGVINQSSLPSKVKSFLNSGPRKHSKSSYNGSSCSVFTLSPSSEMTNQERSNNGISTDLTSNRNFLFVSPFPSNSSRECRHKSLISKQSSGSPASYAHESKSRHPPFSVPSDSKGVRFKFSSNGMEELGYPNGMINQPSLPSVKSFQRSRSRTHSKSSSRTHSKSSCNGSSCSIFTLSPSYEMTSQGRRNNKSSTDTTSNRNILFVSPCPSNSTRKCRHRSVTLKRSPASPASFEHEGMSRHQSFSVPFDSKGVRFKFSANGIEEYPHDKVLKEILESPQISQKVNDVSNNLSTLMKHF